MGANAGWSTAGGTAVPLRGHLGSEVSSPGMQCVRCHGTILESVCLDLWLLKHPWIVLDSA